MKLIKSHAFGNDFLLVAAGETEWGTPGRGSSQPTSPELDHLVGGASFSSG